MRRRRGTLRLLVAAAAFGLPACVTPLAHPIRVQDGPLVEAAFTPIVFTGNHGGCDNFQGCQPSSEPGAGINIHLSGGWGTVLADTFGILGGIYLPAQDTLKAAPGTGYYSFVAAYGWFTVQSPWTVLGVGPELGPSGWGLTVGGSVRPWGEELTWSPELGVYGRMGRPWEVDRSYDRNAPVPGWEVGVRLQVEFLFLQYAYYRHTHGVLDFTIYETSVYTDTMHLISIGMDAAFFHLDELE